VIRVALSPKTARTLNMKKQKQKSEKKTSCAAVRQLYRMFACVGRWQIIATNEKFGFQPLLECVEHC